MIGQVSLFEFSFVFLHELNFERFEFDFFKQIFDNFNEHVRDESNRCGDEKTQPHRRIAEYMVEYPKVALTFRYNRKRKYSIK